MNKESEIKKNGEKLQKKLRKGLKSIMETHPYLFDDSDYKLKWNYEKNQKENIFPENYSYGSGKKVWWKCNKNKQHIWKAEINKIIKGKGCPFCSNKKILHGNNDLKTLKPELFDGSYKIQWDFEKNNKENIYPENYSYGSQKKVWWVCSKNEKHSWKSAISSITKGIGCPICSNQKIIEGINDLKTLKPELFDNSYKVQWDFEKNNKENIFSENCSCGSDKKVWWRCNTDKRHRWKGTINNITKGEGCPICSNKKIVKDINDLKTLKPELFDGSYKIQWNFEKNNKENIYPENYSYCSSKKVWWKCSKDERHSWKTAIHLITRGSSCPICSNKKIVEGINDLKTLKPELFDGSYKIQWDFEKNNKENIYPENYSYGSQKKVWWMCSKDNYIWKTMISSITNGIGCPVCSNKKIVEGINDLKTLKPELFDGSYKIQWNFEKNNKESIYPEMCSCYSGKKVWWQCNKDKRHKWKGIINNITKGEGCPICSSKKIIKGINDLTTLNPELFDGSYKVQWDFEENNKNNIDPTKLSANVQKKASFVCKKNHHWDANISNIVRLGRSCPYCTKQRPIIGENDLETIYPEIAKEWDYEKNELSPKQVGAHSSRKASWICPMCGKSYQCIISSRTQKTEKVCPDCASSYGEMKIKKILDKYNIFYKKEYKLKKCIYKNMLRFDFAIFDNKKNLKFLIEYQGEQHYKPIDFGGKGKKFAEKQFQLNKKRDKIKKDYCKKNNIFLLEIPYTEYDNIEDILLKEFNRLNFL